MVLYCQKLPDALFLLEAIVFGDDLMMGVVGGFNLAALLPPQLGCSAFLCSYLACVMCGVQTCVVLAAPCL